jgi:preprotein translocase subunit SecE
MASKIEQTTTFLSDVLAEMKKVTWPGARQTASSTLVVIVFTIIVSLYLFGVDAVVHWIFNRILS